MFTLPADLTIGQVEACKESFLSYIDSQETVELDDSDVNRIDTVGIQLILFMVLHSVSLNKPLSWQATSSVVISSVKQLGISDPTFTQYIEKN